MLGSAATYIWGGEPGPAQWIRVQPGGSRSAMFLGFADRPARAGRHVTTQRQVVGAGASSFR
jgi:hypothetical protein